MASYRLFELSSFLVDKKSCDGTTVDLTENVHLNEMDLSGETHISQSQPNYGTLQILQAYLAR